MVKYINAIEQNNISDELLLNFEKNLNEFMESNENELENHDFENRVDLSQLKAGVEKIKAEIGKVIVGQEMMVDLILIAILADGHILLEGVPGVAKTLASKLVSRSLAIDYSRVQFTPDLMPSDVLGTSVFNLKTSEFEFKKGPIFSNIVLIDEINSCTR